MLLQRNLTDLNDFTGLNAIHETESTSIRTICSSLESDKIMKEKYKSMEMAIDDVRATEMYSIQSLSTFTELNDLLFNKGHVRKGYPH